MRCRQQQHASSALASRTTRSRSIGDRDTQAFVGNGPDDCSGRLDEVTQSLRLRQRWLRQTVGRQSSLTEKQLSNRCAKRDFGQKPQNTGCFYGDNAGSRPARQGRNALYLCSCTYVSATLRGAGGCTAQPISGIRNQRNGRGRLIWSAFGSANPSGRYCHRPCAACRWKSPRSGTCPRTRANAGDWAGPPPPSRSA